MLIQEILFAVALPLVVFASFWALISGFIRTKRTRRIFFWINLAIAGYMVGWIATIQFSGDPSESMVIFVPLTFEFFHVCLGLIAALVIRFLERRAITR